MGYKCIFSFFLISFISSSVHAGSPPDEPGKLGFGGKVGLNIVTYGGEDADRERVDSTNTLGFAFGGFATIALHHLFMVQPEIAFMTKGTDVEVDGEYSGGFNLSYLEIPLLTRIGVPLGDQVKPYVLAGPQLSILLSSEVEEEDGRTSDDKDDTQALDAGLIVGAGAALAVPSLRGTVLVEARYDWGLRKVYPESPLDMKTRTFSFLIGYQY